MSRHSGSSHLPADFLDGETSFARSAQGETSSSSPPPPPPPLRNVIGVLLDFSGSMRDALQVGERSRDESVARTHALFSALSSIVASEVDQHNRDDRIFIEAFGMAGNSGPQRGVIASWWYGATTEGGTVDFVSLLEEVDKVLSRRDVADGGRGYGELEAFARDNDGAHAVKWIHKLNPEQACILHRALVADTSRGKTRRLLALIDNGESLGGWVPGSLRGATGILGAIVHVENSEAMQYAREIIQCYVKGAISDVMPLLLERGCAETRDAKKVSALFKCLLGDLSLDHESSKDNVNNIVDLIKPHIYGATPLIRSLGSAKKLFANATECNGRRVLVIVSDGDATDGDQDVRVAARDMCRPGHGDVIVCCFLTNAPVQNGKQLFDRAEASWTTGERALFDISTKRGNATYPVVFLARCGWELPFSGTCKLFLRANNLDVVNEFCHLIMPRLMMPQEKSMAEGVLELLGNVSMTAFLVKELAQFQPDNQDGETCYAHAIAAVFYFAMKRIVGRANDVPQDMHGIRERILAICEEEKLKKQGERRNTEEVLRAVRATFRLHYSVVDEDNARRAINARRPVVARFSWTASQKARFESFFAAQPNGVLTAVPPRARDEGVSGHAVVLVGIDPETGALIFKNSWEGLKEFRVRDSRVLLNTQFFDVFWEEDELLPTEKTAFLDKCRRQLDELCEKFPSVRVVVAPCPFCHGQTAHRTFTGDVRHVQCTGCEGSFIPENRCLQLQNTMLMEYLRGGTQHDLLSIDGYFGSRC